MKKISIKILDYLINENNIKPNECQVKAVKEIEKLLSSYRFNPLRFLSNKILGIYIHGSVGTGKSILIKAIHMIINNSEIFHFSDFIFHLQSKQKLKKDKLIASKYIILVDEFFINNLTNLILFKNFLNSLSNKIIILTSNKKPSEIYQDSINKDLCEDFKNQILKKFYEIRMKSNVDYRSKKKINDNFFFFNDESSNKKQDLLRKKIASSSSSINVSLIRRGNKFSLNGVYGNTLDVNFVRFFKKKLVFQDYEVISKKWNIIILRDIPQIDEDSKDVLARFISFIDVIYENKNVLSLSTRVTLDKLYLGKTKEFEFKRTISRLKEIGSDSYINKYLKI